MSHFNPSSSLLASMSQGIILRITLVPFFITLYLGLHCQPLPSDPVLFFKIVKDQYVQGAYEEVLQEINDYLESQPLDTTSISFADILHYKAKALGQLNQFDVSLPLLERSAELMCWIDSSYSGIADTYDDIIHDARLSGAIEVAKKYGARQLAYCDRYLKDDPATHAMYIVRYSFIFMTYEQQETADSLVDVGLALYKEADTPMHPELKSAYNVKGIYNKNKGRYAEALYWYERGLNLLAYHGMDRSESYTRILMNKAIAYRHMDQVDSAIAVLTNMLDINEELFGESIEHNEFAYVELSNNLVLKGDCDGGLKYGWLAVEAATQVYGKLSPIRIEDELAYRENLIICDDPEGALDRHEELLEDILELYGERSETYNYHLRQIGKANKDLGRYAMADQYFYRALSSIGYDPDSLMYIKTLQQPRSLMAILNERVDNAFKYWEGSEDELWLEKAALYAEQAMYALKLFRKESTLSDSKLLFTLDHLNLVEKALDITSIRFGRDSLESHIQDAIQNIELSKGILLSDNVRSLHLGEDLLPQPIYDQGEQIQSDLESIQNQLSEISNDSLFLVNSQKFNVLIDQREKWHKKIEEEYPSFANTRYANWQYDLEYLRSHVIGSNDLLLDYFEGERSYFIVAISEDHANVKKVEKTIEVEASINGLLGQTGATMDDDAYDYFLYNELIGPELGRGDFQNIIILPDGKLQYLPFDILKSDEGVMLIEDYNISRTLNFTSLSSKRKNNQLLAVAPEYEDDWITGNEEHAVLVRDGTWSLPGAQNECQVISEMWGGRMLQGASANADLFTELSGDYGMLHLSMHAIPSDTEPLNSSLLFSNKSGDGSEKLNAEDIYDLDLDAHLVVLSACNTGIGKLQKGEGVQSLAHAFAFAGVPATVMSLWKVPDDSTSKIMVAFYKYLKEGLRKDESLRLAKLDYLRNTISAKQRAPYYWAGFVLVGDSAPIPLLRQAPSLFVIMVTALSVSVLIFGAWKYYNRVAS